MNRKILRQVAKKHKVSVKEVRHEIEKAIGEAYKNPTAKAMEVNFKGDKPTAEELINHVVNEVKR